MASTRELRRHIRSIRATRQVTKAMEMVSSSKMRRAITSTLATRPYAERALAVIADLNAASGEVTHPLLTSRPVKKVTLVTISSDRGLAGAYDSSITRAAAQFIQERQAEKQHVTLITLGRKSETALSHLGFTAEQSYPHSLSHPDPADTTPISSMLTGRFLNGETDEVYVVWTSFKSALKQETELRKLLPLRNDLPAVTPTHQTQFLYEPSPEVVLNYILPRLVDAQFYQFLQESLASEHAARRLAMNNASENASSIIDDLQLTYNGVRQSSITQEIAEITGGAAALEER